MARSFCLLAGHTVFSVPPYSIPIPHSPFFISFCSISFSLPIPTSSFFLYLPSLIFSRGKKKNPSIKMVSFNSSYPVLFTLLLFFLSPKLSLSVFDEKPNTIYEVLSSNGLPVGLLPKGISDFRVDQDGGFEVHLGEPCNAKFENQVRYEKNISGTLSYGQIGALSGISAQELFLWFPVKGIRVDVPSSGLIYFDVGVIYKQFSLSLFETPPDCKAAIHLTSQDLNEGKAASKGELANFGFQYDQDLHRAVL